MPGNSSRQSARDVYNIDEDDNEYDQLAHTQRLKAAIHYSIGQYCEKIGEEKGKEFSKQFIAVLSETTFRQCQSMATDLELFAKHAKRSTVNGDDVKLLARKHSKLVEHLKTVSDQNETTKKAKKSRKQKSSGADESELATALVSEESNM